MNKKERTRQTVSFLINMGIVLVVSLFFYYVWQTYYHEIIFFFRRGNYLILGIYIISLVVFNTIYGGFRLGFSKKGDLIFSQIISLAFANMIVYVETIIANRILLPVSGFLAYYAVQIVITIVLNFIIDYFYYKVYPPRKTLLIYEDDYQSLYERILRAQRHSYDIQSKVEYKAFLQNPEMMDEYECILAVGLDPKERSALIHACYEKTKSIYVIPDVYDIIVNSASSIHIVDSPVLMANNFGPSQVSKIVKRLFDIVFSLVVLLITSPLMLITAIAILLNDGGPVLYKQKRLTQYGKTFEILKFRSMRKDAEKDGVQLASENDDRITSVGKVIRATRMDELPQLLNILKGDMSVVGPRPERPEIVETILKDVPEFNYRLKVKAGLTGYAQVYGKYNTPLKDKLLFDLYYIENYSLIMDLRIIFLTFKILFVKESTEGVQESTPIKQKESIKG